MSERYVVEETNKPCSACNEGGMWTVLDTATDTRISTDYGDQELAEYICERMNEAFEAGTQEGAGK